MMLASIADILSMAFNKRRMLFIFFWSLAPWAEQKSLQIIELFWSCFVCQYVKITVTYRLSVKICGTHEDWNFSWVFGLIVPRLLWFWYSICVYHHLWVLAATLDPAKIMLPSRQPKLTKMLNLAVLGSCCDCSSVSWVPSSKVPHQLLWASLRSFRPLTSLFGQLLQTEYSPVSSQHNWHPGFLSRWSDGLELTAWFVVWSIHHTF